jgi:hypothetical protein
MCIKINNLSNIIEMSLKFQLYEDDKIKIQCCKLKILANPRNLDDQWPHGHTFSHVFVVTVWIA